MPDYRMNFFWKKFFFELIKRTFVVFLIVFFTLIFFFFLFFFCKNAIPIISHFINYVNPGLYSFYLYLIGVVLSFLYLKTARYEKGNGKFSKKTYDKIRETSSVLKYRVETKDLIYPLDIVNDFYLIKKITFYDFLSLVSSFIIILFFWKYFFKLYVILFLLLFFIFVYFFIVSIFFYFFIKKNKNITLNVEKYNSWFLRPKDVFFFFIILHPLMLAYTLVYFVLAKIDKKNKIIDNFKFFIFFKIFHFPFWFCSLYYSLYKIINSGLNSTNWSKKKILAWPSIFLYELKKKTPFEINNRFSFLFGFISTSAIRIQSGKIIANNFSEEILKKWIYSVLRTKFFSNQPKITTINELTTRHITPPHRVSLYHDPDTEGISKIWLPNKRVICNVYSKQPSIRMSHSNKKTDIFNINKDAIGEKKIIFNSETGDTYVEYRGSYKHVSCLPLKVLNDQALTSFFKSNNISNNAQYRIFKTFENLTLIKNAVEISKDNFPIAYYEGVNPTPVYYSQIKREKLTNETLDFYDNILPQFENDLTKTINDHIADNNLDLNNYDIIKEARNVKILAESMLFKSDLREKTAIEALNLYAANDFDSSDIQFLIEKIKTQGKFPDITK